MNDITFMKMKTRSVVNDEEVDKIKSLFKLIKYEGTRCMILHPWKWNARGRHKKLDCYIFEEQRCLQSHIMYPCLNMDPWAALKYLPQCSQPVKKETLNGIHNCTADFHRQLIPWRLRSPIT
jgi:hypothetical protein